MILNATNISKSFGSNEIIKSATFLINEHEKAAIVGVKNKLTAAVLHLQRMQSLDICDRSIM